jgi:hypothetical protein
MNTMSMRLVELPGNLRKGDLVEDETAGFGSRMYVITEPPVRGLIMVNSQPVPVVYLVGLDDFQGKPVKITKAARVAVLASREIPLNGRTPPVFYRPEPTALY